MPEPSSGLSLHQEGLVIITLPKPIGCIGTVLIDPNVLAVSAPETRMMQSWCGDLLR
jgi:hypothetical protein